MQYKELITTVSDILVLVMVAFFITFFKKIKEWLILRKSKTFDLTINKNSRLNNLLVELRLLYEADRVMFFQLHNGEYFLSGESNMKSSMTHFVVRTGIESPIGNIYQNVPTTHLVHTFQDLKSKGYGWYEITGTTDCDPTMRHLLALVGTRWTLIVPVKKSSNAWMGFIALSWMEDTQMPDLVQVQEYAQQIADILNIPSK
jgi:hypothetical protein